MRSFTGLTILTILLLVSISCTQQEEIISFTPAEKEWIRTHPTIVLAVDNTYPPLNYENKQGQLVGLNIDMVKLIEDRLGIDIILVGSPWSEALEKAMNHEVDGIINATPLPERMHRLNFTESVTSDPQALICNKSIDKVSSFKDFQDKKIASKKNSRQLMLLQTKVPVENIVEIETLFEGFDLLSRQEIDAVYDDLAPLYHIITSRNLTNIKIALIENNGRGSTLGLRNDDPMLLSVMNKAINSIPAKEKTRIREKWIHTGIHDFTKYYIAIGVLFLIALIVLVWNRMLNLIVKRKTDELVAELKERKRIEQELFVAKERAEESDRLKTAFLANMSHEIRTPMNGIVGFSGLLTEPGLSNELREKYVKIVIDSGEQLLSIVNDILDISRIESEEVEISEDVVDLNSLCEELLEIFSFKAQSKGIKLTVEKGLSDENRFVICDKVKLNQVLNNLLSNALKFTEKGFIHFGYKLNSKSLNFFVKDSGIGISEEMQSKIFDRFRQAELDLTRQYGGTGLGLSISEKLVLLMDGRIWLESEPGKGATFHFQLPYKKAEIQTAENEATEYSVENDSRHEYSRKNILIAEDEEVNFLFIKELLKNTGINILRAHDGNEAIEICSNHPEIDLILMDIKMPVMDGYEATRRIKKLWPEIPVIAQTAYALSSDMEKAFDAGCDDYIAKPLQKEHLMEKIKKLIQL
jgi:two-component system sensor histidine kinase EvgS